MVCAIFLLKIINVLVDLRNLVRKSLSIPHLFDGIAGPTRSQESEASINWGLRRPGAKGGWRRILCE